MSSKLYPTIGLGGTFDRLHVGHQFFLHFASDLGAQLQIGLATDELTRHKQFAETIQSFVDRKKNLSIFLEEQKIAAEIFALNDVFGPTVQPNTVNALAVTELTQGGGEAINQARRKHNLPPLPLHVCALVKDELGESISSTRIREGCIDRKGNVYLRSLLQMGEFNASQRTELQQKQGKIVQEPSQKILRRFVVGDIVLETFIQNKWPYVLGIFDGRNQRNEYHSIILEKLVPEIKISNPAGHINQVLSQKFAHFLHSLKDELPKEPTHFYIQGEEDLAAVSLTLLAPIGSAIYYGQPHEGIVELIVTEEIKAKFLALIHSS